MKFNDIAGKAHQPMDDILYQNQIWSLGWSGYTKMYANDQTAKLMQKARNHRFLLEDGSIRKT